MGKLAYTLVVKCIFLALRKYYTSTITSSSSGNRLPRSAFFMSRRQETLGTRAGYTREEAEFHSLRQPRVSCARSEWSKRTCLVGFTRCSMVFRKLVTRFGCGGLALMDLISQEHTAAVIKRKGSSSSMMAPPSLFLAV